MKHIAVIISLLVILSGCGDDMFANDSSLYYSYYDDQGNALNAQYAQVYFPRGCDPDKEEWKLFCFCLKVDIHKYDIEDPDFQYHTLEEEDIKYSC